MLLGFNYVLVKFEPTLNYVRFSVKSNVTMYDMQNGHSYLKYHADLFYTCLTGQIVYTTFYMIMKFGYLYNCTCMCPYVIIQYDITPGIYE